MHRLRSSNSINSINSIALSTHVTSRQTACSPLNYIQTARDFTASPNSFDSFGKSPPSSPLIFPFEEDSPHSSTQQPERQESLQTKNNIQNLDSSADSPQPPALPDLESLSRCPPHTRNKSVLHFDEMTEEAPVIYEEPLNDSLPNGGHQASRECRLPDSPSRLGFDRFVPIPMLGPRTMFAYDGDEEKNDSPVSRSAPSRLFPDHRGEEKNDSPVSKSVPSRLSSDHNSLFTHSSLSPFSDSAPTTRSPINS